ncbi:MAG TPA: dienelactone hydrolase family protein [Acidimicrobiales bacterium]|nr:dienelactone hydrolase family protein [Acidimicrobiales bacterium]
MRGDLRARTTTIVGHGGDEIEAYLAEPATEGSFGGVVVIHHMPGYDDETKEATLKFAANGYLAVCPNLYSREAPGEEPEQAAAKVRSAGGVPDDRLVGDIDGAMKFLQSLQTSNGKVGTIGYCSGGRQSFLSACSLQLDAAVDCYGAFVVNPPPEGLGLKIAPIIDKAGKLSCPLLGLFGAEDQHPSPEEVAETEKVLAEHGKTFEFHVFEGAGHAFFSTARPFYRVEAANEGWKMVLDWFERYLGS